MSTTDIVMGKGDMCVNDRTHSVLWMIRFHRILVTYSFSLLFKK